VSVRWLALTEAASAAIEGDRQFRLLDGYGRLLMWMRGGLDPARTRMYLNTVVRDVRWTRGHVEVNATSPLGAELGPFTARALILTLPLGVLAAPPDAPGAVRLLPDLPAKRAAMARLAMGPAVKVILRFHDVFWDAWDDPVVMPQRLPGLSFLLSDDDVMPTWWTSHPVLAPTLTGWAAGPRAARLADKPESTVMDGALAALARVLDVKRGALDERLDGWSFHDWSADPFSRGAYSYVCAGGLDAPRQLGEPVEKTLFFAGEATDPNGHTGTVHAALASGRRAADEVLACLGQSQDHSR
jgi:monoamine oxidase